MSGLGGLSAAARGALLDRLAKRRETAAPALPGADDLALIAEAGRALGLEDPFFRVHEGTAGARTRVGGRALLNFASYDYLGFNADPRVHAAANAAIARYGVSASASRLVSGERPVHGALESALAAHFGAEAAIAFVSGHATNVTAIGALLGPRDLLLHDALIHNSVLEGARLAGCRRIAFAHGDAAAAARELAQHRARHGRALIAIEGHYGMDGDAPDLAAFVRAARAGDAWLMVDEAHATGVLGARGGGVAEHCGTDPAGVDLWMGTLSKALASCGGVIAGRREVVEHLRRTAPGFVYSVGLAPPLAAAALCALELLRAEPERVTRLHANAGLFLRLAREAAFDTGLSLGRGIVPIVTGSSVAAVRLAALLFEAGVNAQPILFPAVPERAARVRFFLSAAHTEADVREAVAALVAARARL